MEFIGPDGMRVIAHAGGAPILYLDMIAFRNRIKGEGAIKVGASYLKAVAETLDLPIESDPGQPEKSQKIKLSDVISIHVMSDAVCAVGKHIEGKKSLTLFILGVRYLFQGLLAQGFVPRGALAFGQVFEEGNLNILVSDVLEEAYYLEQNQEWMGVAVAPSFMPLISNLKILDPDNIIRPEGYRFAELFFVKYEVPMKEGLCPVAFNWWHGMQFEKGIRHYLEEKYGIKGLKLDNTIKFVKKINPKNGKIPMHSMQIAVGSNPPPIIDGVPSSYPQDPF